jgi:hypothetical protein
MPVANQAVAQGLQRARQMAVQRAVASAPVPGGGAPATGIREIQAAGAQQAAQSGQIQNQATEATQKATAQVAQAGLAQQAAANTADLSAKAADTERAGIAQGEQLAKLGSEFKQKLFDDRVKFAQDETGRKLLNEYQLAAWSVTKAKSQEALKDRMQKSELAHKRKIQMLEMAERKIAQALEFEQRKKEQDRNQKTLTDLAEAKRQMEAAIAKAQADAANTQAMWTAAGTVVGAAAGIPGGPAGMAAGASIGGAAGSYAGTTQTKQQ